jgi:hypothetical protein
MANSEMLVRIKADTDSYNAGIAKAIRTLDGFKQDNLTLGGIINQSTKSIVAAAAQYASFAAVIGTVASGFAEAASKGMEMSKEAEGVKAAFDRLNQPGLLDNLREATHGTVNDLELMKQAVKFDNFNLSLEQMGTFLAFAQQQAKDTGQDVNYLVDSIVTGLGRKSLPILDNLGLSAEEIKNRMKETGDMTTAVAEIIQERMEAAGGYVETAADRAAQGQARLDNAMKELGDTMNSLTGAGATLWTDLKIGAIDLANNAIRPLIQMFNSLANFLNGPSKEDIVTRGMTDVTDTVDDNGRLIRKNAIASIPEITVSGTAPKKKNGGSRGSGRKAFNVSSIAFDANKAALAAVKAEDEGPSEIWKAITEGAKDSTSSVEDLIDAFQKLNKVQGVTAKDADKDSGNLAENWRNAGTAIGAVGAAMSQIEDPAAKVMGTIAQAIATIALTFASSLKGTFTPWDWIAAAAAGTATMISTIAAIHSATGYAQGGIVKGNSYSGDNIYGGPDAMVNAGELVLSRSQQGNLASQLQDGGLSGLNLDTVISGEDIRLVLNNNGRRTGRGEYVQSRKG